MEITRNGVTIKLTEAEVREAYDLYLYECQLEDAQRHFETWLEDHFDTEEQFVQRYGFIADEVCYPEGTNFKLDKFVQVFNNRYQTSNSEDYIWSSAIDEVMSALPKPGGDLATYRVTYKEVLYYHFDVDASSEEEAREIWNRENAAGNPDYQTNRPDEISFSNIESVAKKEEEDI